MTLQPSDLRPGIKDRLMVLKTQPERVATIRRMAALPGSGVRPDQVTAIAQAFEKVWSVNP